MTEGARAVRRTLALLEAVADRGGARAKELAEELDLPLPTVYRLAGSLVDLDYLVHIKGAARYELGYKLHGLGVSLHRQIGLSAQVRREIVSLHQQTGYAAYLSVRRGTSLALIFVADSPECPRLQPMTFGFHEAPHATAFGKLLLADLSDEERKVELARRGLPRLTPRTITDPVDLDEHLKRVARRDIAWEFEEFLPGSTCAAVATGALTGGCSAPWRSPAPPTPSMGLHLAPRRRSGRPRDGSRPTSGAGWRSRKTDPCSFSACEKTVGGRRRRWAHGRIAAYGDQQQHRLRPGCEDHRPGGARPGADGGDHDRR